VQRRQVLVCAGRATGDPLGRTPGGQGVARRESGAGQDVREEVVDAATGSRGQGDGVDQRCGAAGKTNEGKAARGGAGHIESSGEFIRGIFKGEAKEERIRGGAGPDAKTRFAPEPFAIQAVGDVALVDDIGSWAKGGVSLDRAREHGSGDSA